MKQSLVITPRVINTIKSLPEAERVSIVSAIAGELILGHDASSSLTPMESIVYAMIRSSIEHDSRRAVG